MGTRSPKGNDRPPDNQHDYDPLYIEFLSTPGQLPL